MNADRDKSEQPAMHVYLAPPDPKVGDEVFYLGEARPIASDTSTDTPEPRQAATEAHGDTRINRYAVAIYDQAVDHPMWIGDDGGALDYHPDRELYLGDFIDEATAAVMAVADAEQAELRAEVAEVVRQRNSALRKRDLERGAKVANIGALNTAIDRAEAAERALADERAKVARVGEILAVDGQWYSGPLLARKIEAALAGPEPDATAGPTHGGVVCLDKAPHEAHWHVIRADGIVFAQGTCIGVAEPGATGEAP